MSNMVDNEREKRWKSHLEGCKRCRRGMRNILIYLTAGEAIPSARVDAMCNIGRSFLKGEAA